jgi:pre-mRNA-splicing factor ISY1
MAMLNRWVRAKRELGQKKPLPDKEQQFNRPEDPSEVGNLTEAEAWRGGVVREIIKKVADIQNGSLAEFKIWELNDSINELVKVKGQWERRVLELGGRDYRADAIDKFGDIPMDGSVYQYYGAAKKLQPSQVEADT